MATFNIGDIVMITTPTYLAINGGKGSLNVQDCDAKVLFVFTDINNDDVCVLEVEGYVCPFLAKDLKLKDAAPTKLEKIEPANSRLLDEGTYKALSRLGILDTSVRAYNRGASDYSRHVIQPWSIWLDYELNPWDADIVKRILRTKEGDSRRLDYEKIIHICEERIRQIDREAENNN